ncbi:Sporulation lipoprotein YhcN/YlaJ (Spore_YhcN_YlaJ) [Lentibacillus persicus]|uniref:Sporulation lipoprotein YhcN/YlaJ (Spore_YhcN_YlaJ) n=1 Tax=Lentibacillus persicus TaxID=640948 RepID=A0A1I1TQN0_9BACI|nr:YhcN/YlaJ family sporulation lipoprotein [Lentibacillus persicus]SFD57780.1 Sporulation lipoprotein YhcN/YlaJ (Spore_YhcN_YlaJ) [Lentibacillus persicus]
MQKTMWIISLMLIVLVGCAQYDSGEEEGSNENLNSQPINYETKKERNERLGKDTDNSKENSELYDDDLAEINEGDEDAKTDIFTNEMSQSISKQLKQRKDIRQAQVVVTDERVVVGVMLTAQAPPDMREVVEQEVSEVVSDKEVYVYTDDIYWDRMRNKDAELDQFNGDVREFLREFFNRNREHF